LAGTAVFRELGESSSRFSVLGSQFSVLSFCFSVLGSRFPVFQNAGHEEFWEEHASQPAERPTTAGTTLEERRFSAA
jgi:hypothetical protein